MKIEKLLWLKLAAFLLPATWPLSTRAVMLVGVESDTGKLYEISTNDASLSLIGNTGISGPGSLECAPNRVLYCFSTGGSPKLYSIDPATAQSAEIGALGFFSFEGGLAFAPDGTAYGANSGGYDNPELFRLDLLTGQATVITNISGGEHDINGLAWRSDGVLVGLDHIINSPWAALLAINPQTGESSVIAEFELAVGDVGGMAAAGDTGYFSTAGPGAGYPGSNELYSFNLISGEYSRIGSFPANFTEGCPDNVILGRGISGLALVPDPPPGPEPRLSIALLASTQVEVAWRGKPVGYGLEAAPNLPAAAWSPVTNCVSACGGRFSVVIDIEDQQRFFRLRKL